MPLIGLALHVLLNQESAEASRVAVLIKNASVGANAGYVKRMSNHLAAALAFFCLLQIGILVRMGGPFLLHLSGIVAIGAFAILAKGLERRWEMGDRAAGDAAAEICFRRDVRQLWLSSLAGGLLWLPISLGFRALFG